MNSPRKGTEQPLQAPSVGRRGKISDHTPRDEVWANQKAPSSPRDPAAANQEGRPYRCTQGAPCCCSQSPVSVGHGWRCRFHCPPSLSVGILVTDVEKKTKKRNSGRVATIVWLTGSVKKKRVVCNYFVRGKFCVFSCWTVGAIFVASNALFPETVFGFVAVFPCCQSMRWTRLCPVDYHSCDSSGNLIELFFDFCEIGRRKKKMARVG